MPAVRQAIAALRQTPGLTITALFVLALGIGATAAIFSVVSGVLLRPLPFPDPASLVQFEPMGVLDFKDLRAQSRAFSTLAVFQAGNRNLQDTGAPERVQTVAAERGLFDLLGVRPLLGRTFARDDSLNVAVVSEGFWRRRFGETPWRTDWTITLDLQRYTVIGIMPRRFQFPYRSAATEIWIPMELPVTENQFQRIDVAIGRLAPAVTLDAARAELDVIVRQLEAKYPASNQGQTVTIVPLAEAVVGQSRNALLILFGAVAMVLLIACANVTNLLLARAEGRKHDVAVRTALGARRSQLVRQLLTENVVLALAAGIGAVGVALGGMRLLIAIGGPQIPRALDIGLDWRVFLFLLAVSLATGITFGLIPALTATKVDVARVLQETGGRSSRGRRSTAIVNGLVVIEIALAFILLMGAGLLLRALVHLENAPIGIVADHVLTIRMETRGLLPDSARDALGQYFRAIEDRVLQIPGVRAAGFATLLHIQNPGNLGSFAIAGQPEHEGAARPSARLRYVSPGYFRALGIPLRAGRLFSDPERGVVVNEALVRRHFAGTDPVGRVLDRGTIIGVVGDVRQRVRLPAEPEIYSSMTGSGYSAATLVVSAQTPPEALGASVRAAIGEVNASQPVFNIKTMGDVVGESHPELDLYLRSLLLFAGLALFLAMTGIYGVITQATVARQREFGIRLALGADGSRLLRLVLTQGALLVSAGLSAGMAGAFALTRLLRAQLYGVTATDPMTFAGVALVLATVAVAACLNPARRVMRLNPLSVLRSE